MLSSNYKSNHENSHPNNRFGFIDEEGEPAIKYSVRGDTITMYFDGHVKKDKFWITDDTLFVENKSGDGGCGHFERIR